jgi:malate synthase
MHEKRVEENGLLVDKVLHDFIEIEALPGTGVETSRFWQGFAMLVREFAPRNAKLLAVRDDLQAKIDEYHRVHKGQSINSAHYEQYLRDIGYLVPEPDEFSIRTRNVDDEIARIAGPQLVVPVSNARYALNAVNARWGSLYDALYGTDAIPEDGGATRSANYNQVRGLRVIAFGRKFLDQVSPLARGHHQDVRHYGIKEGLLAATLDDGTSTPLAKPEKFVAFRGDEKMPSALLLRNHNLHVEIKIDPNTPVGRTNPAGIADLIIESAITTIIDLEDSVAAVDAEDKVAVYRNWLGLMRGTLVATFEKDGETIERRLNPDRRYHRVGGGSFNCQPEVSC